MRLSPVVLAGALLLVSCNVSDDSQMSTGSHITVVAAQSSSGSQCIPGPLSVLDERSGDRYVGPTGTYTLLALSPGADVLAVIPNADCSAAADSWSLMIMEVPGFQELATIEPSEPGILVWSPTGDHLAVVGIRKLTIVEAGTWEVVGDFERHGAGDDHGLYRTQTVWPGEGPYLFVFLDAERLTAVPRERGEPLASWPLACEGQFSSPMWIEEANAMIRAFYHCGGGDLGETPYTAKVELSLSGASVRVEALDSRPHNPFAMSQSTWAVIESRYPGSIPAGSGVSSDRSLKYREFRYSPSVNLADLQAAEGESGPADIVAILVVEPSDGVATFVELPLPTTIHANPTLVDVAMAE